MGTLSCVSGSASGTQTIDWNNGQTSHITWTGTLGVRPAGEAVFVINGTVTSGQFMGGSMTEEVTIITTQSLQCLTPKELQAAAARWC